MTRNNDIVLQWLRAFYIMVMTFETILFHKNIKSKKTERKHSLLQAGKINMILSILMNLPE